LGGQALSRHTYFFSSPPAPSAVFPASPLPGKERLHVDGRHQSLLLLTRHQPQLTLRPSITPQNATAMAEGSIKSRIAALNLEEVHTPVPDNI
jgi:hypothetical protein